MPNEQRTRLSGLLGALATSLDITTTQYGIAEGHYNAVADWFGKDGASTSDLRPDIYPQGSFRLGTVVRPISEADEYDIDLVCELDLKPAIGQHRLKTLVGDRLKEKATYKDMLDERNRCWTLSYPGSVQFHMDVMPAIPDGRGRTTILVPDSKLAEWQFSNPRGFAEWFKGHMEVQFLEKRAQLAEAVRKSVEEIPEFVVKTPLQQAIQIMKRHRDIAFQHDQNNKPISIIITTLAAHAYGNEADLLNALETLVERMPRYVENKNGEVWIANPVNADENFAEKWGRYPERQEAFMDWLGDLQSGLRSSLRMPEVRSMKESLEPRFGTAAVNKAAAIAFPTSLGAASSQQSRPRITIPEKPNKPWGL